MHIIHLFVLLLSFFFYILALCSTPSLSECDESLQRTLAILYKNCSNKQFPVSVTILHIHSSVSICRQSDLCTSGNSDIMTQSFVCAQVDASQVHVRLCSLPLCPELARTRMPQCCDVGKLLAVSGRMKKLFSLVCMKQLLKLRFNTDPILRHSCQVHQTRVLQLQKMY